jgi:hypothetical protein
MPAAARSASISSHPLEEESGAVNLGSNWCRTGASASAHRLETKAGGLMVQGGHRAAPSLRHQAHASGQTPSV